MFIKYVVPALVFLLTSLSPSFAVPSPPVPIVRPTFAETGIVYDQQEIDWSFVPVEDMEREEDFGKRDIANHVERTIRMMTFLYQHGPYLVHFAMKACEVNSFCNEVYRAKDRLERTITEFFEENSIKPLDSRGIYQFIAPIYEWSIGRNDVLFTLQQYFLHVNPEYLLSNPDGNVLLALNLDIVDGIVIEGNRNITVPPHVLKRTDRNRRIGIPSSKAKRPPLTEEQLLLLHQTHDLHMELIEAEIRGQGRNKEEVEEIQGRLRNAHGQLLVTARSADEQQLLLLFPNLSPTVQWEGRERQEVENLILATHKAHTDWVEAVEERNFAKAWRANAAHASNHIWAAYSGFTLREICDGEDIGDCPTVTK